MDRLTTIDQVLENITQQLHLSKETQTEIMAEIRTHLEDAVRDALAQGKDEQEAIRKAAQEFGLDEAGAELQQVHSNHESVDAIAATALPLLFAVILRWLAFAPDGSAVDWRQLLIRPGFMVIALVALLFPIFLFHRWRFALAMWGIFWLITVIFVLFPNFNHL